MLNLAKLMEKIDGMECDRLMYYDAYQLLADRVGIERQVLRTHARNIVSKDVAVQFETDLHALFLGKPLHRILGYRYFWKDKFELSEDTLEPRPDTEILIETCLKYVQNLTGSYRIIDLGTGSGCILLSLLREYLNASGVGVDISRGALETAKHNAQNLALANRVVWQQSDWLKNIDDTFDIIVSNPPYIPSLDINGLSEEVKTYDPLRALDGGGDGLDVYRQFVRQLPTIMHDNTLIILEIGYDQEETVPKLFIQDGYKIVNVIKDYSGHPRCVVLRR